MDEQEGCPLTIGEARGVAQQIRDARAVDKKYWPWVIDELCGDMESLQRKCDGMLALMEAKSYVVPEGATLVVPEHVTVIGSLVVRGGTVMQGNAPPPRLYGLGSAVSNIEMLDARRMAREEEPVRGEVLAVGPGKWAENRNDGHRYPVDVQVGQVALFGRWSGTEIPEDEELVILSESEILAVVEKE